MPQSTERGLALILVMWSLVLLTTIGLGFGYAARVETGGGLALSDQVRAEAVAGGGVRRAIAGLIVKDRKLRWPADGLVRELPWPDAILRASVRPESAKIDLNAAPRELLMGLFANLIPDGDAEALADAVLLRRDSGNGEAATQAAAEPPAARPAREERGRRATEQNRKPSLAEQPFATVDELVQVPGFDAATVQRLRPYLTVYSGSAKVDAGTADVEVLAAIPGVTRDSAERFVVERAERLAEGTRLDLASLGAVTNYVDARAAAKVTNVRAMAYLRGGATATVEAVLAPGGGAGFTLLDWREGAPLGGPMGGAR
jgi:general secretion pathway protein K